MGSDTAATAGAEPSDLEVLQRELDSINEAMKDWVPRMHAANRVAFEKFCDDVFGLRSGEFLWDEAGIGGLLVLAKANLIERLIEHERAAG